LASRLKINAHGQARRIASLRNGTGRRQREALAILGLSPDDSIPKCSASPTRAQAVAYSSELNAVENIWQCMRQNPARNKAVGAGTAAPGYRGLSIEFPFSASGAVALSALNSAQGAPQILRKGAAGLPKASWHPA